MKKLLIKLFYIILFIIFIYHNLIVPIYNIKQKNASILSVIVNILVIISFVILLSELIQKINEKNNEIQYLTENK